MWNNYWGGRPRRDLPAVNYNESSEEEDTPFQSPERPPVSRAGSPPTLAVPQLNDNVDEELEQVKQTLINIGHTPLFRKEEIKEEVVEGIVVGGPTGAKVKAGNMPDLVQRTEKSSSKKSSTVHAHKESSMSNMLLSFLRVE